jgi:acyl-coenzyme A thioesterase PaaI-like protein
MNLRKSTKLINFYPPYLGAGISIKEINKDYTSITAQMKMRWWNRNLVGTHFGGSLYSMCDPFYMFILIQHLGKDYIVWDKAASIEFKKPGTGNVIATFSISVEEIASIKKQVDSQGKGNFIFNTEVLDKNNEVVAKVEKTVYVRKK